jgi:hypothetical protein
MDPQRFDALARACAVSGSRRAIVRRLGALVGGGALLVAVPGVAAANHRAGHCTKLGKKCHKHKDCCGGLCGDEGVCLSCAGVVTWADMSLERLDAFESLATGVISDIAYMAEHGFQTEVVDHIRVTKGAIGDVYDALATADAPAVVANPLRTLLETIAAAIDALSQYLEQVYEENYIETGETATSELSTTLAEVPTLRVEIASLREDCAGS